MPTKDPQEPFTRITVDEGKELMTSDDVAVIDVREPHEYDTGHVPNAKLIPVAKVFARKDELPQAHDCIGG